MSIAGDRADIGDALLSTSWRERRAAVERLVDADEDTITDRLIFLVRENNENLASVGAAIQVLARSGRKVLPAFLALLEDPSPDVRSAAALILGQCNDAGCVEALRRLLRDDDDNVRYHAIEALGRMRAREAVDDLLEVLAGRDFFLGFPTIDALMRIGDRTTVDRLLELLDDPLFAGQIAGALAEIGDPSVVEALARSLSNADSDVEAAVVAMMRVSQRFSEGANARPNAAAAVRQSFQRGLEPAGQARLEQIVGQLVERRGENRGPLAGACARALSWLQQPNAHDVELLGGLMHFVGARKTAADALVAMGTASVPIFLGLLNAQEEPVRRLAVDALGHLGDAGVVAALIDVLGDSDINLGVRIVSALGILGGAQAEQELVKRCGHPSSLMRKAVASALAQLAPAPTERLLPLLSDDSPLVRETACEALARSDDERAAERLLAAADDPVERVRRAALEALEHSIGREARVQEVVAARLSDGTAAERAAAARMLAKAPATLAVPRLIEALADAEPWTRIHAARSLYAHIGGEALERLRPLALDSAPPVRAPIAELLGNLAAALDAEEANDIVAVLEKMSADHEPDVAYAAVWALAAVQHEVALRVLASLARWRSPQLRIAAVTALRNFDGAPAVEALRSAAHDPETRTVATQSLAHARDPASIEVLLELLQDDTVRPFALRALIDRGRSEDPEALVEAVRELLARTPDALQRRALVEVLVSLDLLSAVHALTERLEDDDALARRIAIEGLYGRLDARAREALRRLAEADADEGVRRAALRTLASAA